MTTKRKICVVTGSRADYGLLRGTMRLIEQDDDLDLSVFATGMHLSDRFGRTSAAIVEDGFRLEAEIEILENEDSGAAIARATATGIQKFADAFPKSEADLILLLGDRFEIFAAAQAALFLRVPLAHIHGGEITEGAIDEAMRHSITKLANIHFVANEEFARRVRAMGEDPAHVHVTGAPGLDEIFSFIPPTKEVLGQSIGMELGHLNFLVTLHPESASGIDNGDATDSLLQALDQFAEAKIYLTGVNADPDNRVIQTKMQDFAAQRSDRVFLCTSLGQKNYHGMLHHADAVIGNSSSGIIEAPAMGTPTVNIGDRQSGRPKTDSVVDCPIDVEAIVSAIRTALSPDMLQKASERPSAYGDGRAAEQIVDVLRTVSLQGIQKKKFHDPVSPRRGDLQ